MEKNGLIMVNELKNIMGLPKPTIMKVLKNLANTGSSNTLYNKELKIYGVMNLEEFFKEINNNGDKEQCQQKNKKKDYIKEMIFTGSPIQEMELKIGSQLRHDLFKKL